MSEADRNPRQANAVPAVFSSDGADEVNVAGANETPQSEVEDLQTTIQQLRRKTTIMAAELYELEEIRAARDDAAMQLQEARAQIIISNNRRKEMARVIANRNAKIERLESANELLNRELHDISADLKDREEQLEARRNEIELLSAERDASIADSKEQLQRADEQVAAIADLEGQLQRAQEQVAAIADLKGQLHRAHEQVAALKPHLRYSVSWWLKKVR
jgi:chromosome segregation ATPase